MKIKEVFIQFSEHEWSLLRSRYSETEIKYLVSRAADKAIAIECEKIEDSNFNTITDDESGSEAV